MDEETKKKNILDLHFQKYLIIASTSVLVAFTYIIGVVIAFLAKQIKLDNSNTISIFLALSGTVLGFCSIIFFNALYHIKNIPKVVKNLLTNLQGQHIPPELYKAE